ncbi:MAG: N-6 DNA methylase, partial [Bryobacterales bacterium]|nr:N-6 DNA methylase [Bryobacterales bacterium]
PSEVLGLAWEAILEKDYAPVFRPALAVLAALPHDKATGNAIRVVAECANRVADSLSELGYDHAGPLYHRILGSAKSDGAFYTNNLSAIMLARLALTNDLIDWSDSGAVEKLRIIDPACGTGTLLMASLQTIKALVAGRGNGEMAESERNALHKRIVEDVLCGLDINQHGVQLAACNMTLGAPTVDYERMNLVTMPHGPQGEGSPKAGSLEILTAADDARDLSTVTHGAPQRSLETLDAEQVNESEEIRFPLRDLDGCIMNAPFTDHMKRGRKFSRAALKAMQRHEIEIRNRLHERDPDAAAVITTNSISTFFTPLAEKLLRSDRAFLAKVLPVTACTGASGVAERRFLAKRFHIERIVTTHDPKRIAFSENTSIHESLLICRRWPGDDWPPTEFVSLRKMPTSAEEAIEVADAISAGRVGDWGSVCRWPADRIRAGVWTPAQWYDGTLAEAVFNLEGRADLLPSGSALTTGATRQAAQDSWKRDSRDGNPNGIRVFGGVSANIRQTMLDAPEQLVVPGGRRAHLHERVRLSGGHLMLAERYNTVSGRLTALWSETSTFGFGWIPSAGPDREYEKAVCAWWNSTPGRMLLLNRRAKTLTYPKWSKQHLKSVPCPRPETQGSNALTKAWEQVKGVPLLPLAQAESCAARQVIDAAAAVALGVTGDEIADWRRRLAREPTITNVRATDCAKELG